MLAAVAFFSFMDGVLKVFAGAYPPMQVGAMRGAASLPFALLPVLVRGRWSDLRPTRWGMHLLRGVFAVIMLGGFVYALRVLSLADTYAIFFVAPLMVTALSVPVLGEQVGWRRWLAIGVGFLGVMVMLRPGGAGLTPIGALAAIGAAAAYAGTVVSTRVMTRTDTNTSMVVWYLVLLTLFAGLLAAPGWVSVRAEHWAWLAALGFFGFLGQHFITEAFRRAPPPVVAPFEYTAILWGVAIDWAFWDTLPHARVYFGGGIVVGAGLYLIWRERELAPALPQAT